MLRMKKDETERNAHVIRFITKSRPVRYTTKGTAIFLQKNFILLVIRNLIVCIPKTYG